ncbi:hypothetical protein K443DRAFT_134083 [Laccaria amethystina LaAM-08-1]|uniref:Uncharacterized protein n=1 Tax=Laccaria amethystina LaAM-08-1 TaxID=1095629 RepID=A0A0C9WKW3_9AGAR|nr:hypothetical protein K443DRAFT_134083 [Laccaria amethystina LaAM-08-1]
MLKDWVSCIIIRTPGPCLPFTQVLPQNTLPGIPHDEGGDPEVGRANIAYRIGSQSFDSTSPRCLGRLCLVSVRPTCSMDRVKSLPQAHNAYTTPTTQRFNSFALTSQYLRLNTSTLHRLP